MRWFWLVLITAQMYCSAGAGSVDKYVNPVLPGDYSDPDATRVGSEFFLVSSSFANAPGLPILRSTDLVHWRVIGHALPELQPAAHYAMPRHGGGVWAPAIRHHGGKFVIYYPDPDRGIFRVEASNAAGPWSAPVLVDAAKGAIDPCPFWDDDGTGWLVHAWARSRAGISNVIVLKRLSDDGTKTIGPSTTIIDGDKMGLVATSNGLMPWLTTEGPKLYKRHGWYYVFAPSGSVQGGWQGVFRSRSIMGPYVGRDVLDQGSTEINGPHQGAWVTTVSGEDWFLHFQDAGAYGRRVWLEPMIWKNDWPVIGRDRSNTGRGEPVLTWRMPRAELSLEDREDDEFDNGPCALWQWNANPQEGWTGHTDEGGVLRLNSASYPANLWEDAAILTRKLPGERFTATTKLTFAPVALGERSGLVLYGRDYAWIGLEKGNNGIALVVVTRRAADQSGPEDHRVVLENAPPTIYLRMTVEPTTVAISPPGFQPFWPSMLKTSFAKVRFSYSTDNISFTPAGDPVDVPPGTWVGAQIGLFAVAPAGTPAYSSVRVGAADYDWIRFKR